MANLRNMANKLGDINVSNFDELMGGKELGDELTALHYQNYNFTSKTLKKGDQAHGDEDAHDVYQSKHQNLTVLDSADKSANTSNYGGASSFREYQRPQTA